MAKNNQSAQVPLTVENAKDAMNQMLITNEQSANGITYNQAFELLENAKPSELSEATSEYFTIEEPGEFNFFAYAISEAEFNNKGKTEVVELRDKSGRRFINGDAIVVSTVKRMTQLPAFIRIIWDGSETKNSKGSYKNLRVLTL